MVPVIRASLRRAMVFCCVLDSLDFWFRPSET